MNSVVDITVEELHLDLRGLPANTAKAVPALLRHALRQSLADEPLDQGVWSEGARDLHLTIAPNQSAPEVARDIARALIRNLRRSHPETRAQTP